IATRPSSAGSAAGSGMRPGPFRHAPITAPIVLTLGERSSRLRPRHWLFWLGVERPLTRPPVIWLRLLVGATTGLLPLTTDDPCSTTTLPSTVRVLALTSISALSPLIFWVRVMMITFPVASRLVTSLAAPPLACAFLLVPLAPPPPPPLR